MAFTIFEDSTWHGLYYLSRVKSKKALTFWLIITCTTTAYAILQTVQEVHQVWQKMNKFDTEQRLATAEDASEASHVEVEISFYNPFDIVDVSSVEQSARRLNVSASMAVYLIGRYTWEYLAGRKDFNITDLLLMSKSDNDYGMKNLKASMIMKFLGSVLIHYRNPVFCINTGMFAKFRSSIAMGTFRCTLIFHRRERKLVGLNRNGVNIGPALQPERILIKKIGNQQISPLLESAIVNYTTSHIKKFHALGTYITLSRSFLSDDLDPIRIDNKKFSDIEITPILFTNHPTYKEIYCVDIDESFSLSFAERRGIDCFHWLYDTRLVWHDVTNIQEHNLIDKYCQNTYNGENDTCIAVRVEPIRVKPNTLVRIYVPAFQLYTLIANIGGTFVVWTGASVLSLVHLMILMFAKISRKIKVVPIV